MISARAETISVRLAVRTPLSTKSSGVIFAVTTACADADKGFVNTPDYKLLVPATVHQIRRARISSNKRRKVIPTPGVLSKTA
jgi:hypothetical protein